MCYVIMTEVPPRVSGRLPFFGSAVRSGLLGFCASDLFLAAYSVVFILDFSVKRAQRNQELVTPEQRLPAALFTSDKSDLTL
jgi:hypothetical protein